MKRYLTALCFTGGVSFAVLAATHLAYPWLSACNAFVSSVLFYTASITEKGD